MRSPRVLVGLALLIYGGAMTAYVYAFEHRSDADYARQTGLDEWLVLGSAAALHVALGAFVNRWAVLLAPALPVLISIPAGEYPGGWPDVPVVATMITQMTLFGVPLVALGVLLRRALAWRKGARERRLAERGRDGSPPEQPDAARTRA